jgi:hypothetical protein
MEYVSKLISDKSEEFGMVLKDVAISGVYSNANYPKRKLWCDCRL